MAIGSCCVGILQCNCLHDCRRVLQIDFEILDWLLRIYMIKQQLNGALAAGGKPVELSPLQYGVSPRAEDDLENIQTNMAR